jgi:hypothetical protein
MSTRNSEAYSKIVGWLMGTLVTRVKVNPEVSFRELLLSCRNSIVEGVDHVFYQYSYKSSAGDLVNDLGIKLEWTRMAVQLNVLDDASTAQMDIADFEPYHTDMEYVPDLFDIAFLVQVFRNGILVNCKYKYDLIDKSEISDACEQFVNVLQMAVHSPDLKMKYWKKGDFVDVH